MYSTMKKMLIALLFATSSLFGASFSVDTSHSSVTFEIKHMMISTVDGSFKAFEGDIDLNPDTKTIEAVSATIDAASIDTGIEKRDNHLRSADFFEVEKFPNMTFTMTSFKQDGDEGVITGDLTIRGITKEVKLESEITGMIVDRGTKKVGMRLEGKINRKDFGLNWNRVIEAGGFAVGEEVKIKANLQLHEKLDLSKL